MNHHLVLTKSSREFFLTMVHITELKVFKKRHIQFWINLVGFFGQCRYEQYIPFRAYRCSDTIGERVQAGQRGGGGRKGVCEEKGSTSQCHQHLLTDGYNRCMWASPDRWHSYDSFSTSLLWLWRICACATLLATLTRAFTLVKYSWSKFFYDA